MAPRARTVASLALLLTLLGGCPQFQQAPVNFWGRTGFVSLGQEQIFVLDRGRGPTILLIHGYGASHDSWIRVIPELSRDHRVLAVDLPGFGRSDKYDGDYSPGALADKLLRILDQKGVREVDVAAHSWGSSIALSMALAQPRRVRSLTLLAAWVFEEQLPPFLVWSRAPGVGEALYALFYKERLDDRMALSFYDPEPYMHPDGFDQLRRALGRPGAVAAALAAARGQRFTELQRRYSSVTQPALLIWGRQDRVSRLHFGERLVNELPHGRLVVVEQCGHIPMFERPGQVLRAMRDFLPRETAAAPPPPAPPGATRPAPASTLAAPGGE